MKIPVLVRISFIVMILLLSVTIVKAQTTYTWTGTTSTAWATTTNWSPAGNPGSAAGDVVQIGVGSFAGSQPTLSVAPANALASITLGTATNATLTISVAYTTGLLTIDAGSTVTESGAITPTFTGGITNSGTFTASTGVHTFATNAQALAGTLSIPSATVTAITLTNNGTLTVGTALAGTGGLTNSATGTLNIGGSTTTGISITTLTATVAGNTVNYTGAAQTIKTGTYVNLGLSGTGAKTTATVTVNGVFDVGGNATVVPSAAPTFGAAATVQFSKTAAYTATTTSLPTAFAGTGGLIIAGAGNITPTAVTALRKLTVNLNATFALAAVTITIIGAVSNAGTITASTGQLNQNAGDAGFTNTGTITYSGAGRIYFSGDMTNTGTMTLGSA
jgi:hypothetical protein